MIYNISEIENKFIRKLVCVPYGILLLVFWFVFSVVHILVELCDLFEKFVKNALQGSVEIAELYWTGLKKAWKGDTTPIKVKFSVWE